MSNNKFTLFGIFRSKTRTLLLVNFFINSEKEYYIRQLEKDLKIPASMIHREIKKLLESRLISSRRVGNIILYKIDKESPFYNEIRELTLEVAGIDKLIKPIIEKEKDVVASFIYGSYAKGDFDASSDIDLFVLAKKDHNLYEKINSKLVKYEDMLKREFNIDFYLLSEYKKKKTNKDTYILDILKNQKVFIKGGETDI